MNFKLITLIGRRFAKTGTRKGFLNFARTIAFISVMLGSAALIISLSVLDGFDSKLRESAVKFTSHIQIHGFNGIPIHSYHSAINAIQKDFPSINTIDAVIERQSLIRSKSAIEGVLVKGIDTNYNIGGYKNNGEDGSVRFSTVKSKEIVIGRRLAEKLNLRTGDKIVMFSLENAGSGNEFNPEIDQFIVTGIYHTGFEKYDESVVYIPIMAACQFYKISENESTSLEIMLKDIAHIDTVASALQEYVGYKYICNTVYELHSAVFSWIELQKAPIPLVLGLISIVAVFNIITILLITIVEKTRSISILRSIGMKNSDLLILFVFQGVFLAVLGSFAGCLLGLGFGILQDNYGIIKLQGEIYYLDTLPVKLSLWHYEIVIGCCFVLSIIASLIPSLAAIRITPVKGLRFR
jgi:lipoprotein-releasing system permease protein